MTCPYYHNERICLCLAVRDSLTPSLHERERYCRSDEPARCPTFRLRQKRTDALPQETYYALWLGDETLLDPVFPGSSVP